MPEPLTSNLGSSTYVKVLQEMRLQQHMQFVKDPNHPGIWHMTYIEQSKQTGSSRISSTCDVHSDPQLHVWLQQTQLIGLINYTGSVGSLIFICLREVLSTKHHQLLTLELQRNGLVCLRLPSLLASDIRLWVL